MGYVEKRKEMEGKKKGGLSLIKHWKELNLLLPIVASSPSIQIVRLTDSELPTIQQRKSSSPID